MCSEPESGFGSGLLALQISSVEGLRIRDLGVLLLELRSSYLGCWCEKELPAGDKSPPSHPRPVASLRTSNLDSLPGRKKPSGLSMTADGLTKGVYLWKVH